MRYAVGALVILLLALGLGSALSWVSVRENQGFGALTVGAWTAWPRAGSALADPYTTARVAADGEVPLGAAEGVVFTAKGDDSGAPLRGNCRYMIAGKVPQARLWSLTAISPNGAPVRDALGAPVEILSGDIVWQGDESLQVLVSAAAAPGNWLPVDAAAPFHLVMTIYDSQSTSGSSVVTLELPSITRRACSA